ncbi:hypothetical protein CHS0354_020232 [Potamilus streckersoni]|uniref:FZ domain-containing protein n=1 Tax=Potamilus streckersoni TaxID=2493646 RepID=A0AAE0S596_9BIVA|nr:hypothetical protein CHS0354_020232 [Potamilus streckersoni]
MNSIFNASEFSKVYSSTEIVNISSGSVVVNFIIHLHTDVNIVSSTEVHLAKLILDGMSSGPRFFILDWKSIKITIIDTHTPVIPSPLAAGQCVPVELRPCINMTDYTNTAFPNVLGHTSAQQVIDIVTSRHIDLFTNICYGYSTDFWCSVFNPECKDGNPVPPCREYCEDVYSGCGEYFRRQFSAILNCSSLPEAKRNNMCRSNPYKRMYCLVSVMNN